MVGRGTNNRQSCSKVYTAFKRQRFERNQSLVVIHGKHSIETAEAARTKKSISRVGTKTINAIIKHCLNGRSNYFLFFIAQQSTVSAVRINSKNRDAWFCNSKIADERLVYFPNLFTNRFERKIFCYIFYRNMSAYQCHPETVAGH